jgi:hypothetical protein
VLGYPLLQPKQVPKKVEQLSGHVQQIRTHEKRKAIFENVFMGNTLLHIRTPLKTFCPSADLEPFYI